MLKVELDKQGASEKMTMLNIAFFYGNREQEITNKKV